MDITNDPRMIQQIYQHDTWKMLVGCIMLNQTSHKQVRPVITIFFDKYPTPNDLISGDLYDIINILKPLGLYNVRCKNLKNFSTDWINKKFENITELRGIGKYASDSFEIFIKNNLNVKPTDKVLLRYLENNI